MSRYCFEIVVSMKDGWNLHTDGGFEVELSAKEAQDIVKFMCESPNPGDYDDFHAHYSDLDDRINGAAQECVSHLLKSNGYEEEEMECYSYHYPEELREAAEYDLGHPIYQSKDKVDDNQKLPFSDEEIKQWAEENADDLFTKAEDHFQEREAIRAAKEEESSPDSSDEYYDENEQSKLYQDGDFREDVFYINETMEDFEGLLADIEVVTYSSFEDDETTEHYIAQIGDSTKWGLSLEHPMDIETHKCTCGSSFAPVHEIRMLPVSDEDAAAWRAAAHKHSDLCRRCDKDDWNMDYPEYDERDLEYQEAYNYIDADYDEVNAVIDSVECYKGEPMLYWRY